ncbi:formate dehydrogenase subunit delta [Oryzibacter oryziterrae]|uniref:formate dehydrogenase subunit delta n=1 Tax=Oryzibacter oryziterrae TaxID=2766474 RepID=UPI001F1E147E|nr:formate dehydrogenase subunit delta [Oryzibacter oryziterrae]
MSSSKLVTMANQIALAFQAQGEERALPQIRAHVEKFWDPRMREGLRVHLSQGGDGLDPLALRALAD